MAYFDDTQKFLDWFKKTTFDVVVLRLCEETIKLLGWSAVIAAFRYAQLKHDVLAAHIGFYLSNLTLGAYVGVSAGILVNGLIRRSNQYAEGHTRLVILVSVLCSLVVMCVLQLVIRGSVDIEFKRS